ncbi:hypothetical protein KY284_007574 [Solanum tuberosum]|nr:hypothetical protein KY284_007574 [Solanum tuberosum]
MSTYLGQVRAVMEEFNELMSATPNVEKQLEQHQKMFLVVTLAGLPSDLDAVRDQILASFTVPVVDDLFTRLLRLAAPPMSSSHTVPPADSSVLASQTAFQTGNRHGGRHGKQRPRCGYYNELDHTREVCYSLHGKPKNAHVAQTEYTGNSTNQLFSLSEASKQTSSSIASVAQVGNPVNLVACITRSTTLGPWVMDTGASDHISGPQYGKDDWRRA